MQKYMKYRSVIILPYSGFFVGSKIRSLTAYFSARPARARA